MMGQVDCFGKKCIKNERCNTSSKNQYEKVAEELQTIKSIAISLEENEISEKEYGVTGMLLLNAVYEIEHYLLYILGRLESTIEEKKRKSE